jgi:hypothetical protein
MSRTHDVTISAFDLDRIDAELTAVTEQRDRLAEEMRHFMSDTPETDAEHAQFPMGGFTLDFARKLERERDRLAEALFMCRRELVDVLDDINKERVSHDGDDFHEALRISREALAAVEGGSDD